MSSYNNHTESEITGHLRLPRCYHIHVLFAVQLTVKEHNGSQYMFALFWAIHRYLFNYKANIYFECKRICFLVAYSKHSDMFSFGRYVFFWHTLLKRNTELNTHFYWKTINNKHIICNNLSIILHNSIQLKLSENFWVWLECTKFTRPLLLFDIVRVTFDLKHFL
jgi:hypothetical protein